MSSLTTASVTGTAITNMGSIESYADALLAAKTEFEDNKVPIKSAIKISLPSGFQTIKPCDYIQLDAPLPDQGLKFVESVTISNDNVDISLRDYVPEPENSYSPPSSSTSSSSGNTSRAANTAGATGTYQKKIRVKGAELGTFDKIFKYFKKDGSYGMKYEFYYNHKKGGAINNYNEASGKYNYTTKRANCVDFAWLIYEACKGANIKKVGIVNGKATFGSTRYGHAWNTYQGKRRDASSTSGRSYVGSTIITT